MKQSLHLGVSQHLAMTPQLQQSIRLLQLSTVELRMAVQEALESNLMLDTEDDDEESADSPGQVCEEEASIQPVDIPEQLPVDSAWEDIYDDGSYGVVSGAEDRSGSHGLTDPWDLNHERSGQSLPEHLLRQMDLCRFNDTEKLIAITIIDAIDDRGYLLADPEEIRQNLAVLPVWEDGDAPIALDQVESVLRRIQSFEPAGVGARDLRECLLVQLFALPEDASWRREAQTLVEDHLDLLAKKAYGELCKRLGLEEQSLRKVISLIKSLDPNPGTRIDDTPTPYIVPDVLVRKQKDRWHVSLNQDVIPRIRINSYYAGMVRRADSSIDNQTLKTHLQEARWFLKGLKDRNTTLLKVATCIVERQRGFLEYGDEAMEPMVTQDIADDLGLHASTISRVTTRKYMHTPRGVYEFKYLFSSYLDTQGGDRTSSTAVRALIKKIVAAEDIKKPVSDAQIANKLQEQGIRVARRTVAKYREGLGIPTSTERRRFGK